MNSINISFLISLSIIALGYIAKRSGIIQEKDGDSISRIIFNFTLPAVVVRALSSITIDFSLLSLMIISLVYGLFMSALGLFIFRKRQRSEKGMLTILLPSFNIGLFAYPIVEMIWGNKGLTPLVMFDMGNALIVFISNYLIAGYYSGLDSNINLRQSIVKVTRSVPLIVFMITLFARILHISYPEGILMVTDLIGKANMPLALLVLGIYLNFGFEKSKFINMIHVLSLRYGIGLITGIAFFLFFPVDPMIKTILLIAFILPISLAVIPYSVEFKYDNRFVGTANNASILVSYCIMWFLVGISR